MDNEQRDLHQPIPPEKPPFPGQTSMQMFDPTTGRVTPVAARPVPKS